MGVRGLICLLIYPLSYKILLNTSVPFNVVRLNAKSNNYSATFFSVEFGANDHMGHLMVGNIMVNVLLQINRMKCGYS